MNAVPVVGSIRNVGVYNLLYWNLVGGDAIKKRKAKRQITLTGVTPHSPPNMFVFGLRSEVENGTPYIGSTYDTSTIDHFDLYVPDYFNNGDRNTIYYGCVLLPPTEASVPTSCNITVDGFDRNGHRVATEDLRFLSAGGLRQPMSGGSFPSEFVGLEHVTFSVQPPGLEVVMDNLVTRVYQKKP